MDVEGCVSTVGPGIAVTLGDQLLHEVPIVFKLRTVNLQELVAVIEADNFDRSRPAFDLFFCFCLVEAGDMEGRVVRRKLRSCGFKFVPFRKRVVVNFNIEAGRFGPIVEAKGCDFLACIVKFSHVLFSSLNQYSLNTDQRLSREIAEKLC